MEGDDLVDRDAIHEDEEDSVRSSPDSSIDSDEASMAAPKKRRGEKAKVVVVKMGGDAHPPPDSFSWRKYGQKPIKGSPYPRGYYRCSSSKGCPSRKQVERSSLDPTMLRITYSYQHNHPLPTTTPKHHRHPTSGTSATTTDTVEDSLQQDLEPHNSGFYEFTADLEWFSNMGSTSMLNSPTFVGPKWADADVTLMVPIGEEDQSLFGDLGELPECSVVFRRPCSARG